MRGTRCPPAVVKWRRVPDRWWWHGGHSFGPPARRRDRGQCRRDPAPTPHGRLVRRLRWTWSGVRMRRTWTLKMAAQTVFVCSTSSVRRPACRRQRTAAGTLRRTWPLNKATRTACGYSTSSVRGAAWRRQTATASLRRTGPLKRARRTAFVCSTSSVWRPACRRRRTAAGTLRRTFLKL